MKLLSSALTYLNSSNFITAPDGPIIETPPHNDNQWRYLAFIRKGDRLSVYIDAKLADSKTGKEGSVTQGHAFGIHLGQRVDGINRYRGVLDEFRFWNRSIEESEIKSNMEKFPSAVAPRGKLATTWGEIK